MTRTEVGKAFKTLLSFFLERGRRGRGLTECVRILGSTDLDRPNSAEICITANADQIDGFRDCFDRAAKVVRDIVTVDSSSSSSSSSSKRIN